MIDSTPAGAPYLPGSANRGAGNPSLAPPLVKQFGSWTSGLQQMGAAQAAAELELADHLVNGPLSVSELARRANAHAPNLYRLLRALETIGLFKQVSPRVFANTPASEALRKGVPGSMWAAVRSFLACGFGQVLLGLVHSVRTGETTFEHEFGCSFWEYLGSDPSRAAIFDATMGSAWARYTRAVTAAYDWSRFPVIADIGGGNGSQLIGILDGHPSCQGILFDQPEVVVRAIPHDRIERVGGSFFERVPSGADGYTLRKVIHDWDDEKAIAILKTVRAATKPSARVILLEEIVPETAEFAGSKWWDLSMMALFANGRERTAAEYRQLLEEAGFELEQIVPTSADISLVISRPRT